MSVVKLYDGFGNPIQSLDGALLTTPGTLLTGNTDIPLALQGTVSDSSSSAVVDPAGSGHWYWTNEGDPYGQVYIANFNGIEVECKKSQMRTVFAVVRCDKVGDVSVLPILAIYSWPTGDNDYQPWYHSRWAYNPSSTQGWSEIGRAHV